MSYKCITSKSGLLWNREPKRTIRHNLFIYAVDYNPHTGKYTIQSTCKTCLCHLTIFRLTSEQAIAHGAPKEAVYMLNHDRTRYDFNPHIVPLNI
jgi:hypothetical protein